MGMGSERTRDPMFEQSPDEWDRARVCALTCRARARVAASVCVCVWWLGGSGARACSHGCAVGGNRARRVDADTTAP
jgi:hypothetical protein